MTRPTDDDASLPTSIRCSARCGARWPACSSCSRRWCSSSWRGRWSSTRLTTRGCGQGCRTAAPPSSCGRSTLPAAQRTPTRHLRRGYALAARARPLPPPDDGALDAWRAAARRGVVEEAAWVGLVARLRQGGDVEPTFDGLGDWPAATVTPRLRALLGDDDWAMRQHARRARAGAGRVHRRRRRRAGPARPRDGDDVPAAPRGAAAARRARVLARGGDRPRGAAHPPRRQRLPAARPARRRQGRHEARERAPPDDTLTAVRARLARPAPHQTSAPHAVL